MHEAGVGRVGLEDDIYYDYDRKTPARNEDLEDLVNRIVRLAQELQRPLASPSQVRSMLGMSDREREPPQ